jgi:prolyl-tRNA synthetase
VSTRMIGGLVMTHGDDNGLRIPPRLAPTEVVIVPIWKSDEERTRLLEAAQKVKQDLSTWNGRGDDRIRVHIDAREGIKPGAKYYEWELRGVPLRLELGPRDLQSNSCMVARRDGNFIGPAPAEVPGGKAPSKKAMLSLDGLPAAINDVLTTIQNDMLAAALARREANSHREPMSYDKFKELMEGDGGFVYAGWNGDPAIEAKVKEETKATIRCIPDAEFRSADKPATCMVTGEPAQHEVVWAKAY